MTKPKTKVRQAHRSERKATRTVASKRDTPLVRAAGQAAELGDQPPLVTLNLLTIGAGLLLRRPAVVRTGVKMLAAHALATGIKSAIKHRFDRTRPEAALDGKRERLGRGGHDTHDQNSFPSGHSAGAVAVATAIADENTGLAGPAAAAAAAICAIQVPRGSHYATDVAAGALIGWLSAKTTNAALDPVLDRAEAAFERLAGRR